MFSKLPRCGIILPKEMEVMDLKGLIKGYTDSCTLVKARIDELTGLRNSLKQLGDTSRIEELDLDRRIKLLYNEYEQMQEIISDLSAYMRRREKIADS